MSESHDYWLIIQRFPRPDAWAILGNLSPEVSAMIRELGCNPRLMSDVQCWALILMATDKGIAIDLFPREKRP